MMTPSNQPDASLLAEAAAIEAAVRAGAEEALQRHKLLGRPMVEARDGQVVWVPADQLPVVAIRSH